VFPIIPFLLACRSPEEETDDQLWGRFKQWAFEDNAYWQDPQLIQDKYEMMGENIYKFMRGTASWYSLEKKRLSLDRLETSFLNEPDAQLISVIGDAHIGNIGATLVTESGALECPLNREESVQEIDLNYQDLDGTEWGPWLHDLERGALSLSLMFYLMEQKAEERTTKGQSSPPTFTEPEQGVIIDAYVRGYMDAFEYFSIEDGGEDLTLVSTEDVPDPSLDEAFWGKLMWKKEVEDALQDFENYYDEDEKFNEMTDIDAEGNYVIAKDTWETFSMGTSQEVTVALEPEELITVEELFEKWKAEDPKGKRDGFVLEDGARRYGDGVASIPAKRWYLLINPGLGGQRFILEVREVKPLGRPEFASEEERMESGKTNLWDAHNHDGCAAVLESDEGRTYKALSLDPAYRGLKPDDIYEEEYLEGDVDVDRMIDFAGSAGFTLGASHARGSVYGQNAGSAIEAILADWKFVSENQEEVYGILAGEINRAASADLEALIRLYGIYQERQPKDPLLGSDDL